MEIDDQQLKNFELAWKNILENQTYIDMVKKDSDRECISIFRFKPKVEEIKTTTQNCSYYVADKDSPPWKVIFEHSPDANKINKHYNHEIHILICVSMPQKTTDEQIEDIMKIKMFAKYTIKEINFDYLS